MKSGRKCKMDSEQRKAAFARIDRLRTIEEDWKKAEDERLRIMRKQSMARKNAYKALRDK